GLLYLSHPSIRSIRDQDDLLAFVRESATDLGPGAEAFKQALISRMQAALTPDETELCRRLAITVGAFQQRLARALWAVDRSIGQFPGAWSGCLRRVLDHLPQGRYRLPYLYQQGFRDHSTPGEQTAWHAAAAEELAKPVDRILHATDIRDSVFHRLLAGNL